MKKFTWVDAAALMIWLLPVAYIAYIYLRRRSAPAEWQLSKRPLAGVNPAWRTQARGLEITATRWSRAAAGEIIYNST